MTIALSNLKTLKLKALDILTCKWILEDIKNPRPFYQILSHAIVSGIFRKPSISSRLLLKSLCYSQDVSFSRLLFFQIQNPNVFAYNFMFKAYSQSSDPIESITLYNVMLKDGTLPDNYTFPFVLKSCGRLSYLNKGQEVHSLSLKIGLESDVFVQNALISMYSACGVVETARRVFDMVPWFVRDVVSWNSMISGYLQSECDGNALRMFGEMWAVNSVRFDEVTLIGALTACGRMGILDLGKRLHGLIMRNGFVLNVFMGSSLIDMYAKCGQMDDARKVFDKIPDRNLVCWTSMVVGYARLDMFKEAIELFMKMQLAGLMADPTLVASVISACGHMGALDQGKWVHCYAETNGIPLSLSVKNALVDMYSKCGDVDKAHQIFNEMVERDVFSWTAMISGLAMNGKFHSALDLFAMMEVSGNIRPNEVTFLGVLSACSHGGFVDEGHHYFKSMSQSYHISPRIEHYGCMVDLLGRANLLLEAEEFIKAMPIEHDVVIWRSLLFACRHHGNIELAELAINRIEELEPRRSEAHVLLSHVYASASRWGDVRRVRTSMACQKTKKQPGCSFVEIDGLVHEFFAEDGSNSRMDDIIYDTNEHIHKLLQSESFDSNVFDHQEL